MYMEEYSAFLEARNGKSSTTNQPTQGNFQRPAPAPAPVFDITSGAPVPPGFQTRRAG